jgi:hypothetical protein
MSVLDPSASAVTTRSARAATPTTTWWGAVRARIDRFCAAVADAHSAGVPF